METKVIIILASNKPTHRQDNCKTGNRRDDQLDAMT